MEVRASLKGFEPMGFQFILRAGVAQERLDRIVIQVNTTVRKYNQVTELFFAVTDLPHLFLLSPGTSQVRIIRS
jgi:hypothetical protein